MLDRARPVEPSCRLEFWSPCGTCKVPLGLVDVPSIEYRNVRFYSGRASVEVQHGDRDSRAES